MNSQIELRSINSIAIIVAMEEEAEPIINKLQLWSVPNNYFDIDSRLKLHFFTNKIDGKRVALVVNGKDAVHKNADRIGTQFATRVAEAVCQKMKPDLIMSAGTAGGLKDSNIGDVYVSDNTFVYCDRVINLDHYREYGEGHFPYFPISSVAAKLGLKLGRVATSNSLDPTSRDKEELAKLDADVVDMEAAAIAEVAKDYEVPVIAVKAVTNYLDKELHTAFKENYSLAVNSLAEKMVDLVPALLNL
ncbi:MAG: hypothetical protein JSR46_02525 [Verrucomicrobia bacterium]|nr:hypothetical protein [Verrucomicrobiota bacterium]